MAPFNKRQIGYIQAIAGRQQHVTLMCGSRDRLLKSTDSVPSHQVPQNLRLTLMGSGTDGQLSGADADTDNTKSLLMHTYHLDAPEIAFDSRSVHQNSKLEPADFQYLSNMDYGLGIGTSLSVFYAPLADPEAVATSGGAITGLAADVPNAKIIPSNERASSDGFLNSTDIKFRFTLPTKGLTADSGAPMGQDHYEFRWIVWRSKKPTISGGADDNTISTNLEAIRDGVSFRNPGYDLFMGQTGRKRGFLGYTLNANLDSEKSVNQVNAPTEAYSGVRYRGSAEGTAGFVNGELTAKNPAGEEAFTVDDLLTMRLNRDDYVIMKDVRFFLGKEHGKSHFEDNLHWDWNDPIDTPESEMLSSKTLNNKNYRWHMTLIGTSGGVKPTHLQECVRWTTKCESG